MSAARTLPERDALIDQLAAADRAQLAFLWSRRAQNERASSGVFRWIAEALHEERFEPALGELARRAIDEELSHHEVCSEVAQKYAPSFRAAPVVQTPSEPSFGMCSRRQARVLAVTLQCAINESLSAAYLGACLDEARSEVARAALRLLLKDEVQHARIGWGLLAALEGAERRDIARHLPLLLDLSLSAWLADDADYPESLVRGHGMVCCKVIRASALATVRDVLLPGFAHVGIEVSHARQYLERYPDLDAS
jgi:hypothetical protein